MGTACASDAARERHSVSIGSDITNLGQSHANSVTTPLWTRSRRFAVCATTSSWVTMIVVNPKSIRMACEHRGDRVACILIEIPRRLVGEEDSGLLDHRPRDGHALLLPTGEFERQGLRGGWWRATTVPRGAPSLSTSVSQASCDAETDPNGRAFGAVVCVRGDGVTAWAEVARPEHLPERLPRVMIAGQKHARDPSGSAYSALRALRARARA